RLTRFWLRRCRASSQPPNIQTSRRNPDDGHTAERPPLAATAHVTSARSGPFAIYKLKLPRRHARQQRQCVECARAKPTTLRVLRKRRISQLTGGLRSWNPPYAMVLTPRATRRRPCRPVSIVRSDEP